MSYAPRKKGGRIILGKSPGEHVRGNNMSREGNVRIPWPSDNVLSVKDACSTNDVNDVFACQVGERDY